MSDFFEVSLDWDELHALLALLYGHLYREGWGPDADRRLAALHVRLWRLGGVPDPELVGRVRQDAEGRVLALRRKRELRNEAFRRYTDSLR